MNIGNRFSKRMMKDQLAVMKSLEQETANEVTLCLNKIEQAVDARCPLPALTDEGESVVVGSNFRIEEIAEYWAYRIKLLQDVSQTSEIKQMLKSSRLAPLVQRTLERVGVRIA